MKPDKYIDEASIEEFLRKHLLEQDAHSPPDESLLKQMEDHVFSSDPEARPSPEKQAEMLRRLKEIPRPPKIPDTPQPGPATKPWYLSKGIMATTLTAVGITALLLIFNPFKTEQNLADEAPLHIENNSKILEENASGDTEDNAIAFGDSALDQQLETASEDLIPENNPLLASEEVIGTPVPGPIEEDIPVTPDIPAPNPTDLLSPLSALYADLADAPQALYIDAETDNLLMGSKGTLIHLNGNSFILPGGDLAKGKVRLEILEILDKPGLLRNQLIGQQAWVSGGAVRIEAYQGTKPLKLAHDKNIYLEFPAKNPQSGMALYHGAETPGMGMQWKKTGGALSRMVPLAMDELDLSIFLSEKRVFRDWNRAIEEVTNPKYNNTALGTREFIDRLKSAHRMGCITEIPRQYLENLDFKKRELWEADFIISQLMTGFYSSYEYVDPFADGRRRFEEYTDEKFTLVEPYKDYGYDLSQPDAYDKLISRGLSRKQADKTMRIYRLRKKFTQELKSDLAVATVIPADGKIPEKISWPSRKRGRGFVTNKLGWNQLALPIPPMATTIRYDLELDIKDEDPSNVKAFLIYPRMNAVIAAIPSGDGKLAFNDLPRGMDGTLVAFGVVEDQPVYFEQGVFLDTDQEYEFKPENITSSGLKTKLNTFKR